MEVPTSATDLHDLWRVRFAVNKLPFFRCSFYKVFSDKPKIIFSSYSMINVEEFYFARLVSCADFAKC